MQLNGNSEQNIKGTNIKDEEMLSNNLKNSSRDQDFSTQRKEYNLFGSKNWVFALLFIIFLINVILNKLYDANLFHSEMQKDIIFIVIFFTFTLGLFLTFTIPLKSKSWIDFFKELYFPLVFILVFMFIIVSIEYIMSILFLNEYQLSLIFSSIIFIILLCFSLSFILEERMNSLVKLFLIIIVIIIVLLLINSIIFFAQNPDYRLIPFYT